MLDLRIYRAAFAPSVLVLVVCAFSLADRPDPSTDTLAPGAFDALRAFGEGQPPQPADSLRELAQAFPNRRPGSQGDQGLAARVAGVFDETFGDERVETQRRRAITIDGEVELTTVVGVRPGLSSRRIVVVAHRDAVEPGSEAELSGTAALLELARVFRSECPQEEPRQCGRELDRTLVLVSTSGGTGGAGGARNWARRAGGSPVDAVLVLGDLAGLDVHKPWVVSSSNGEAHAPLALRRTVEAALRRELPAVRGEPGAPRATAQWARRALPLSPGEHAELAGEGLPALLLSATGERGPRADAPVRQERLEEFGRTALRAISAVDEAGKGRDMQTIEPAFPEFDDGIVTFKRVLPGWAVRLLIGALLLPALAVAVDGLARVRRSRRKATPRLAWVAAATVPFLLVWAWVRLLGLVALDAPPAPVLPEALPLEGAAWAAPVSAVIVLVLGWAVLRPLAERLWHTGEDSLGESSAVLVVLCALGVAVWVANPYAAGVLAPCIHISLLMAAPQGALRGRLAWLGLAAALLAPALVLAHYMGSLGLDPLELAWMLLLAFAGGHLGFAWALALAVAAGALSCAVRLALRRPRPQSPVGEDEIVTRGPRNYAGPGSLGGTKSALRP